MAAVTASPENGEPRHEALLREAGRELERVARLEGIDEFSPLGRWIIALRSSMDALAAVAEASAVRTEDLERQLKIVLASADKELSTLREDLATGVETVRAINSSAELRVKMEEERLKQHQQVTIDNMIASIMGGLKTELYDRLKQQMPHHEQGFYLATRWKAISRLALAGALFFCGGLVAHYALVSHTLERGRYCEGHSYVAENGQAWCDLTPLRVPDRNQN
ncbi:hypothetical protein OQ496_10540 [Acetobacter suratthaniensis]|uniref:DUF3772 domain-containing protein n=1 Tax=Acetobacter suratthaniensis TaxID=1502841 RepID=A0ABS3LNY6_9PROT|nr:hypothetical protein [Acetobacter suratthaniensis]MBO1329087.1 hypothetical protein [Acetobacter suratthaniensis]MCX2566892.1 hypothetical protein [Acetobacter suratthaniensis]